MILIVYISQNLNGHEKYWKLSRKRKEYILIWKLFILILCKVNIQDDVERIFLFMERIDFITVRLNLYISNNT